MPAITLEQVLENMLVQPAAPLEEGGEPLNAIFKLDLGATFNWPARRLDPSGVPDLAYRRFYYKSMGCGYGVFYSIVASFAEQFGPPYDSFPLQVLECKKGRFSGREKLCGTLVGAQTAMALFYDEDKLRPLFQELVRWYESEPLPAYRPPEGLLDENGQALGTRMEIPLSISGDRRCGESLQAWKAQCSFRVEEKERKERCARLTACVAGKTAELLNRGAL